MNEASSADKAMPDDRDAGAPDQTALLVASISVPQHVVYRAFPTETVVLNLQTGKYHGLNATAGRMLEELEGAACVADAIKALAQTYEQPSEVLERDVCQLCRSLLERGLIEVDGDTAG
jgi:Coenzyme PQQ synthesis protein D (PqqD)